MKLGFAKPAAHQRGITMVGMLFMAVVLAAVGMVAAQAVPTVIEYQAVLKAAKKAAGAGNVPEARELFDKAASIDRITSIAGKDLEVLRDGDKTVVRFAYSREIHLAGPAYLTLKYAGEGR